MAKKRNVTAPPRYPERKWGPFHGGVSVAVWLNDVETEEGTKVFRSLTINGRRFRDKKTGNWRDAKSLRPTDLPALVLALEAAGRFISETPLPGIPAEPEDEAAVLENGEIPSESVPY